MVGSAEERRRRCDKLLAQIPRLARASALPTPIESSGDPNKSSNRPDPAAADQAAGWTTAQTPRKP